MDGTKTLTRESSNGFYSGGSRKLFNCSETLLELHMVLYTNFRGKNATHQASAHVSLSLSLSLSLWRFAVVTIPPYKCRMFRASERRVNDFDSH
jgi:hypothetical protein